MESLVLFYKKTSVEEIRMFCELFRYELVILDSEMMFLQKRR